MNQILEWLLGLKYGTLQHVDGVGLTCVLNNWLILSMALVFLALVAVSVGSYLFEGDNRLRARLGVAAVRVTTLLLLCILLGLQPGLVLTQKQTHYSSVLVVVDDSLSMSLSDAYADPRARAALAKELAVSPEMLAQTSRTKIVQQLLTRQNGALARLLAEHPVQVLRFPNPETAGDPYCQPIELVGPAKTEAETSAAEARLSAALWNKLASQGRDTNLAAALRDVGDRSQDDRVAAVVILSDGQTTGGGTDVRARLNAATSRLRQRGVPVFTIAIGDPEPPQNVAVNRLQGPAEARKGSEVEFTAYLSNRNCGGEQAEVKLLYRPVGAAEWEETGVAEKVTLSGSSGARPGAAALDTQKVVLRHEPGKLGEFEYQARVTPLPQEADAKDNAAVARLRVSDEKMKVLLVSGDAGWEFQYLRNLLLRSPQRFAVSVWQQDAEKEFNQEASTGMRLTQLPRQAKDLFEYEVVVLYDPAYTEGGFDTDFVKLLEDFVVNRQGGLCYIAGNKHTELTLHSGGPLEPLERLLPVVVQAQATSIVDQISRGEAEPWPVIPTAEGLDHPVLRLEPSRDNLEAWRALPGVYWSHPVEKLKPGALPLAVSSDPARRTPEAAEGAPVIAVQYSGRGRCLYLGSDESWRWRFVADGLYYRRFWHNALDFLASGRMQKKQAIITTGDDTFSVGDSVRLAVEAYDRELRPLEKEDFVVEMLDKDGRLIRTVTLHQVRKKLAGQAQDKAVAGQYEAIEVLRDVGQFTLTAQGDAQYKQAVVEKVITVTLPQEEFRRPEADLATLRLIATPAASPYGPAAKSPDPAPAAEAGRRNLLAHEIGRLSELIQAKPEEVTTGDDKPHPLYHTPLALLVGLLLLTTEWVLRKKFNMT